MFIIQHTVVNDAEAVETICRLSSPDRRDNVKRNKLERYCRLIFVMVALW
jgi:hypothetical protein